MLNRESYNKDKSIEIKKSNPHIIFYLDDRTNMDTVSEYSKILKTLDIPTRKWHNNKEWVYEKILISVSFRENKPINFSFRGSEKSFPRPYYASMGTHKDIKDEVDRTRCYEVKKNDIKILAKFFKTTRYIRSVIFYRIWFIEFPSSICDNLNIQNIEFYSCRIDKFPNNFKNLSNLEKIYMEFSWVKMPNSFDNCINLTNLEFREACLIDKFPDDIGNCLKLQKIKYDESPFFADPKKLYPKIRDNTGITTLPISIGKIPNLVSIELSNCVNLRSLPEELAIFPWKEIRLDNSGYLMKSENCLPNKLRDFVLIDWNYGENFRFYNVNSRIKPNFSLIIDFLSPIFESLQENAFLGLISTFPERKIEIMRIMEQWSEKVSNPKKKKFLKFISKLSPKIDFYEGNKLFL